MNRFLIAILTVFFLSLQLHSQTDTTVSSVVIKKKEHSAKKAALLSLVPGLGQIYNEVGSPQKHSSWWKIPIIYAGLGAATYLIVYNGRQYNKYADDFQLRTDSTLTGDFNFPLIEDPEQLKNRARQHLTWLEWSVAGGVLIYALNILDAAIDGHFVKFNISEDLSLNIDPYTSFVNQKYTYGVSLTLHL